MQFEEFDNKAQQAADHHHPMYDEQAWTKMEKLLDQHLPQKKEERRRGIFFLLLFLLLGGGVIFLLINRSQQTKQVLSNKETTSQESISTNNPDNTSSSGTEQTSSTIIPDKKSEETDAQQKTISSTPVEKRSTLLKQQDNVKVFRERNVQINKTSAPDKKGKSDIAPQPIRAKNDQHPINTKTVDEPITKNNISNNAVGEDSKAEKVISAENDKQPAASIVSQEKDDTKNTEPINVKAPEKTKKTSGKKTSSFFFSLSLAPDISGTRLIDKSGTTKLISGAGLGYRFNKFTLRTGFYSGRKIYTATPDEYHPPASFWTYYPNLITVDADCKVYEIPLFLSYNFGKSTKQNFSVTAGLSSFLMKKETYHYTYKNQTGQLRYKTWSTADENKHYFSVVTLAAGYQRNINKTFFIATEPYMKLPLNGLGYGRIKLNSAGVQFSVGANLFNSTKRSGTSTH